MYTIYDEYSSMKRQFILSLKLQNYNYIIGAYSYFDLYKVIKTDMGVYIKVIPK